MDGYWITRTELNKSLEWITTKYQIKKKIGELHNIVVKNQCEVNEWKFWEQNKPKVED